MSEEDTQTNNGADLMSDFMQTQAAEQGNNDKKSNEPKPKEKNALEKARDKEKEEKKKELDEAKKNSMYNASKYRGAQANMMIARGKNMIFAIPFIIAGVLVLIVVVKNGGNWIRGGMQFTIKKLIGG